MKILVIGSGGREHAIAWRLAQSPKCTQVIIAPGNAGTGLEDKIINVNITKVDELVAYAISNNIDFTIVGPELPLALGIVDEFRAHNLKIWGPDKFCAQLETSKAFAKEFMIKNNIPTAQYEIFDNLIDATSYIEKHMVSRLVIKADGIAAGKGVLVTDNKNEALDFLNDIFEQKIFGEQNSRVVIEECIDGIEASFIVMVDGNTIIPLPSSQDHKRLLNDNKGPNTGGMGAISPSPILNDQLSSEIMQRVISPVINGMKNQGHTYTGFLYAGIMVDKNQQIKVLEFNCRLGDPETQAILMRLESDFIELMEHGVHGTLNQITPIWSEKHALGVVLCHPDYPYKTSTPLLISGLNDINNDNTIKVFHAGTVMKDNHVYTNAGRVLCVVGLNEKTTDAKSLVYDTIHKLHFQDMQYRTDIPFDYRK